MIRRECYECGLPVELPDGTFAWVCRCGFDQRTEEGEELLRVRYREDRILSFVVEELLQEAHFTTTRDADRERARMAALTSRVERIEARLALTRRAFLRPARARLAEAWQAVRGLRDSAEAWSALLACGLLPASFREAPERRFLGNGDLVAAPTEIDTCVALAADVGGVLEAEARLLDLCRVTGAPPRVIWDDGVPGSDGDALSIAAVRAALGHPRWHTLRSAGDVALAILGAEMVEGDRNPFVPLAGVYAAGYSAMAYTEDDGSDLLVLSVPPLPAP